MRLPSECESNAMRRLDARVDAARDIAAADLDAELAAWARLDSVSEPNPARHRRRGDEIFEDGCRSGCNEHLTQDVAPGVAHRPLSFRSDASACALSSSRPLSQSVASSPRNLSTAWRLAR